MQINLKSLFAWCVPVIFIVTGIYFLFLSNDTGSARGSIINNAPKSVSLDEPKNSLLAQMPTHMAIDDIGISLDVERGSFDTNTSMWTLNNKNAFFASGTTTPILYSHNQKNLFYNLRNADESSRLLLTFTNGTTLTLKYVATRFIDPNDGSILSEKNDDMVILMTCSGISSEMRRIVYFRA